MSFHTPMQTTQEAGGSFLPEDHGPSHPPAGKEPTSTEARLEQTPYDKSSITADHSYSKVRNKSKWRSCRSTGRNVQPANEKSPTEKTVTQSKSAKTKKLSLRVVNKRNTFGESLLHTAVQQADIRMLKDILKLQPDVNMTDKAGLTALHEAVFRDQYQASLCLINAGALINAAARNGVTPLHNAVIESHKKIAKLLLEHGANPLLKAKDGRTALDINTEPALRVLMLKYIPKDSASTGSGNTRQETSGLGLVSRTQQVNITTRSQSQGSTTKKQEENSGPSKISEQPGRSKDSTKERVIPIKSVQSINMCGERMLHKATEEGNTPKVHQLLQLIVDVNTHGNDGRTPPHEAAPYAHNDVVVGLIKAGPQVHATAQSGETPLQDATIKGHATIADVLLKHGATSETDEVGGDGTQLLPALTHQDGVGEESRDKAQLDREEQVDGELDSELNREPDHIEKGQTVSSATMDKKQENQKNTIISLNVRADPPTSPPLSSAPQPHPPSCVSDPPNSQMCSTPEFANWFEGASEEEDSDQTMDYNSSDESVDWSVEATQRFTLLSAHEEETCLYTFPTEMV